jgi:hypothetical protein
MVSKTEQNFTRCITQERVSEEVWGPLCATTNALKEHKYGVLRCVGESEG